MSSKIGDLYDRLRETGMPRLAQEVGDFMLYDSLLAGCASRAARGSPVSRTELPEPDNGTLKRVAELRAKTELVESERLFLAYVDLLESIRIELQRLSV